MTDLAPTPWTRGELRASEARYRAMVEIASDGVFILDLDGRLLEVNETFAQAHGYTAAEMVELGLEAIAPGSAGLIAEPVTRILAGDTVGFEVEHRRRDGSALPLEVTARLIHEGETPVIIAFHRDLSERMRAAEALRESEYFFRESQAAAFIGSYKTDFIAGRWTSSDVLDEIFGIDAAYDRSVAGWLDLVHPDDRAATWPTR
jgi:PAS domain S-box-containing protein